MIPRRYIHNMSFCSEKDFEVFRNTRVAVVGAGGLGGYIIDQLARTGMGTLSIIDPDVFNETNLNRQLYSDTRNIGVSKAEAAGKRVAAVNPDIRVITIRENLNSKNAAELLKSSNLVFDAVDNIKSKMLIQDSCRELKIPFVHGAVGTWTAQISLVMPGEDTLDSVYMRETPDSYPAQSVPPFTPGAAASIQVALGLKFLIGKHKSDGRILTYLDLLSGELTNINLGIRDRR